MNRRRRYDQLEELQLAIFHSLLTGPGTPAWLSERLGVDGGHLSRTLRLMEESGHISITQTRPDRRERDVGLTRHGLGAARDLEGFYEEQARKLLDELPLRRQERLIAAMNDVREILQRDWVANLLERFRDPA